MIRLVTGLPRDNGVGEYVAHLAGVAPPSEIFYGRPMRPEEYEATGGRRPGFRSAFRIARAIRRQPREAVDRSHVVWEGWGPVYGPATRLLTVHHVLGRTVPWAAAGPIGLRERWVHALARRGHRRTVQFGIRVVVPSETVALDLVEEYGADPARLTVIPHGIEVDRFPILDPTEARRHLGLPSGGPVLLHVGTDDRRKNVGGLLAIFRRYRRAHPAARLVHIGRSPLVEATCRAEPGIAITYRPAIAASERGWWYGAADAVVLPSFLEGFGRIALEATAAGRAVVTSPLPAFEAELGPYYRPGPSPSDPDWTSALDRAIEETDRAGRRSWVTTRFPMAGFAARYRRLYGEVGFPLPEGAEVRSQPTAT